MEARSNKRFTDERVRGLRGFSFVELVVSVALVSLIATTLSFALFRSNQKTDRISAMLAVQHSGEDLIRRITEDCRLAESIQKLAAESFEIKTRIIPNPIITITYTRNAANQTLNRSEDANPPEVVGRKVTSFDLVPELPAGELTGKLRSVTIELQIGSDQRAESFHRRVSLLREPDWL